MVRYILGLDLGITSIGWAAIALDKEDRPTGLLCLPNGKDTTIPAWGVRLFESPMDHAGQPKEASKAVARRVARGARRRYRRRRARLKYLTALLEALGLFPADEAERARLLNDQAVSRPAKPIAPERECNPYALRARGLKEALAPHQFGRVLYQFARRRGFQSNAREEGADDDSGKVKKGAKSFQEQWEPHGSPAAYFADQLRKNPVARLRNRKETVVVKGKEKKKPCYDHGVLRDQLRKEFRDLFARQRSGALAHLHPERLAQAEVPPRLWRHLEIMSKKKGHLAPLLAKKRLDTIDDLRMLLETLVFDQLPFRLSNRKRRRVIGRCRIFPHVLRCGYDERIAQEFRLLQKLNDLAIIDEDGLRPLSPDERPAISAKLKAAKKVKLDSLRKTLNLHPDDRFNVETRGKITDLPGHAIDAGLLKALGKERFGAMNEDAKDALWNGLNTFDLDERKAFLDNRADLDGDAREALMDIAIPGGHCGFSKKALEMLIPHLREGKNLYEAETAVQAELGCRQAQAGQDSLPEVRKILGHSITNPTVLRTLSQVRKIVNALIKEFGKPVEIIVELARDLKMSARQRGELIAEQGDNEREREETVKVIAPFKKDPSGDDVRKYRLAMGQGFEDPFTDKKIEMTRLFTSDYELCHIIPRSVVPNRTMINMFVSETRFNREMKDRTPADWVNNERADLKAAFFAHIERYRRTHPAKYERFRITRAEIDGNLQELSNRALTDTAYAAKETCRYLRLLYPGDPSSAQKFVTATSGRVTANLRHLWGLETAIKDAGGITEEDVPDEKARARLRGKNRADHRHHAVDAIVIALTTPAHKKRLADWYRQFESTRDLPREQYPPPERWPTLRENLIDALQSLTVSHKPQGKVSGELHKAGNEEQSEEVRNDLIKVLGGDDNAVAHETEPDAAANKPAKTVVGKYAHISHGPGKTFHKAAVLGNNHHVSVYQVDGTGTGPDNPPRYRAAVVPMIIAARRLKDSIKGGIAISDPVGIKQAYEGLTFKYSLVQGDTVLMCDEHGHQVLARVKNMSGPPTPYAKSPNLDILFAVVEDARSVSKNKVWERSHTGRQLTWRISSMKNWPVIMKVTVDPLGRVRNADCKYLQRDAHD